MVLGLAYMPERWQPSAEPAPQERHHLRLVPLTGAAVINGSVDQHAGRSAHAYP